MKDLIKVTRLPGFEQKAKVGKINIKEGMEVKKGDVLICLEGAKGNIEIEAEDDFKVIEVLVKEGDEVEMESAIAEADIISDAEVLEIKAASMPGFSESAKIGKINVSEGEKFRKGDVLLTLEGAKCNLEVEAEYSGEILKIMVSEGEDVLKDAVLFTAYSEDKDIDEEPDTQKEKKDYHGELVVLGGGPGGYVAAIRAAQRGKKTIIIEMDELGGTCLNRGCIPTKTMVQTTRVMDLINSAEIYGIKENAGKVDMSKLIDRKNDVVKTLISGLNGSMQKHEITVLRGHGKAKDEKTLIVETENEEAYVTFDDLILAPGSVVSFPPFEGADLPTNLTSDDLLELREVPRSLIILGGRVIAMEFAFIYNKLGCDVTVIQRSDTIFPNLDIDVMKAIRDSAIEKGIKIYEDTNIHFIKDTDNGEKLVEFEFGKDKEIKLLTAEKLAVATGRKPNLEGLELEKLGVEISDKTHGIKVDEYMRTNVDHIYAIGDATNIYDLAHVASKHGLVAVQNIMGVKTKMKYNAIPEAIFTDPEVGLVGMNATDLQKAGIPFTVGKFPYMANGKALVENATEGFIKVMARSDNRKIVGAALVGISAADLLSVFTNLISIGATIDEAKDVIYAHPTVSETLSEAIMDMDGESIHK